MKKDYDLLNPKIGFNGLINAHRLGWSWRKIGIFVGLVVLAFVAAMIVLPKIFGADGEKLQQDFDAKYNKAYEDAQQQAAEMQRKIQADIDAQTKASQSQASGVQQ